MATEAAGRIKQPGGGGRRGVEVTLGPVHHHQGMERIAQGLVAQRLGLPHRGGGVPPGGPHIPPVQRTPGQTFQRKLPAAEKRDRDDLDAVLARMAAEDGEPRGQDLAWVQRVLAR